MTITLVSYSTCKKRKDCATGPFAGVSIEVMKDDRIWTTIDYSNGVSKVGEPHKKKNWKYIISSPFFKNFPNSEVGKTADSEGSLRPSPKENSHFEAATGNAVLSKKRDCTTCTEPEYEEKAHRIRFWRNKRIKGVNDSSFILPNETTYEKYAKKHRIRRWLNKENPEVIRADRIKKARCDISLAAAEAANVAAIRNRSKMLTKASAFAAAGFARVVAEEMSPHASHGSIAQAISKACIDVAKTSLVQKADNDDYLRLFRLFHYHYKFRGPNYYVPLEPCCYYIKGPNGESVIHCKMDEPVETFRSSAVAKNSPFVLFLKQVAEERRIKAETDARTSATNTRLETRGGKSVAPEETKVEKSWTMNKSQSLKRCEDKQPDKNPVSQLCNLFSTETKDEELSETEHSVSSYESGISSVSKSPKSKCGGDTGSDTCSRKRSLTLIADNYKASAFHEHSNCEVDVTRILTPVRHFLENISADIKGRQTLPQKISRSAWFDKTSSQCRTGFQSQCFSLRARSVDMIK